MPTRRLFLLVFWTVLSLVVTVGMLGYAHMAKNNTENVQPFPQVDTSISTSTAKNAEPNVTPPKRWYRVQVVVLTYHHVTEQSTQRYAISDDQFARHMSFLHENDLHPISLEEFLRFVETGSLSTENAVLITFDDGYESYYTRAFPVLRAYVPVSA